MSVSEKPEANKDKSSEKKTFVEIWKKWDRRLASAFGLLAFVTLVGIVIYNLVYDSDNCGNEQPNARMFYEEFHEKCELSKSLATDTCRVDCADVDEVSGESLVDLILQSIEKKDCANVELTLVSCRFKNKTIRKGWLNDIPVNIKGLIINMGNVEKIEEGALSNNLNGLLKLHLKNLNIKYLNKTLFSGLQVLEDFEFHVYNQLIWLDIEEEVFKGAQNLKIISFSGVAFKSDGLSNTFGCKAVELQKLTTLDASDGIVDKLTNCSFTKVLNVKQIFIKRSSLRSIARDTFSRNLNITRMELDQNLLTTLENGTFDVLHHTSGILYLEKNPWECNCSLQWLQNDYMSKSYINTTFPPVCSNGVAFKDYDFCKETTTTSSLPTFSSSSTTITAKPSSTTHSSMDTLTINCTVHDKPVAMVDTEVVVIHSPSVVIDNECVSLEFRELDTNPVTVEVYSNSSLANYNFVWFNSNRKEEAGCEIILNNPILLRKLKHNTTYTFSVMHKDASEVFPNCTFGLQITPEWGDRLWISNKHQLIIISVLCSSIVAFVILTVLGTFFCIRSYPKVISGNKSVIVVNSKKNSQDIELPKNYEKPMYWDPYLKPGSQGYLSPKYHRYHKVKYRPPLMRSISEWSYTNNTYDDPNQAYNMKVLYHRKLQREDKITAKDQFEEVKPPLPPPNGVSRTEILGTFDEESIYNSL